MSIVDERVLEYLDTHDVAAPKKIHDEAGIPYTPEYVAERCRELNENGFLLSVGRGVYQITDRGRAYLAGEFDARSLDDEGNRTEAAA